jgi:hypothetical protein
MITFQNQSLKCLFLFSFILFIFQKSQAQVITDSLVNATKPFLAYQKGAIFVSPGINFTENTKNNYGLDVEYPLTNDLGLSFGASGTQIKYLEGRNGQKILNKNLTPIFVVGGGLRLHTAFRRRQNEFDFIPSINYARVLGKKDRYDKYNNYLFSLEYLNVFTIATELRLYVNYNLGVTFGIARALNKDGQFGGNIGLVFKFKSKTQLN